MRPGRAKSTDITCRPHIPARSYTTGRSYGSGDGRRVQTAVGPGGLVGFFVGRGSGAEVGVHVDVGVGVQVPVAVGVEVGVCVRVGDGAMTMLT